jgi:hypothetical protein
MHAVVDFRLTQSASRLGAFDNPPHRAAARVRRTHLLYKVFVVRDALDALKEIRRSLDAKPPATCLAQEVNLWHFSPAGNSSVSKPDNQQVHQVLLKMPDRWNAHDINGYGGVLELPNLIGPRNSLYGKKTGHRATIRPDDR